MTLQRGTTGRYLISVLAMASAIAARAWSEHMGWGPYRFPFLQLAIIVSALFGGLGPGMLAVIAGTLAWSLFLPPAGRIWIAEPVDRINLATFAAVNSLIAWAFSVAGEKWRRSAATSGVNALRHGAAFANRASAMPSDVPLAATVRTRLSLSSPLALAGLLTVVAALAAFGWWGTFSAAGMARFDDEATLIPLTALGLAPAVLIFGIGFLPVFSFSPRTRPDASSADAARDPQSLPIISPRPR